MKVLFISHLSDLFKKSPGPNTLTHWAKEEKESVETANNDFARMDIPCEPQIITVPPREIVFCEISDQAENQDLVTVHREVPEKWKNRT